MKLLGCLASLATGENAEELSLWLSSLLIHLGKQLKLCGILRVGNLLYKNLINESHTG
jgi:hypothetical protein